MGPAFSTLATRTGTISPAGPMLTKRSKTNTLATTLQLRASGSTLSSGPETAMRSVNGKTCGAGLQAPRKTTTKSARTVARASVPHGMLSIMNVQPPILRVLFRVLRLIFIIGMSPGWGQAASAASENSARYRRATVSRKLCSKRSFLQET